MGSVNLQLLHLTDQFKPTMKLLLIASLFVLSVFAEPEAEADAQWYGYNWNNGYYPMSYGYNRWNSGSWNYNRYNMYNRNFWGNRRFYREAEAEAEPEAEADAQYYNWNRGYGYYPYSMNYGYSGYPYNIYNRNFWGNRRFVRDAEADSEAEADSDYYNVGYYGNHQTGSHGYYEHYQPPTSTSYNMYNRYPMSYNMYNRNYNGYNMYNRNFWNSNRFYHY